MKRPWEKIGEGESEEEDGEEGEEEEEMWVRTTRRAEMNGV